MSTARTRTNTEQGHERADRLSFAAFAGLATPAEAQTFGEALAAEGFSAVRRFLDGFRDELRQFGDERSAWTAELVERGRLALPEPGRISPSWSDIWNEYRRIAVYKGELLARIPEPERSGEWQVLLDNPYANGSIAVYPALTFAEAAYLYAYFRAGLEPSEYIRLQRVDTVILNTGKETQLN